MNRRFAKFLEKYHLDLAFFFLVSLIIVLVFFSGKINQYIGIFMIVLGFSIWIIGLNTLGNSFQIKAEAKKLVTWGIYSKIKHPIYYGGFLVDLGVFVYSFGTILFWPLLVYTFFTIFVQLPRVKKEEEVLEKKFGKKYRDYLNKTWI